MEPLRNLPHGAVDDLAIAVYEGGDGLQVDLDGSPDQHDPIELDSYRSRFVAFLKQTVAEPDRPIAQLELVSAAERLEPVAERN